MNPKDFDRWLLDQPDRLPLGDRTWLHNPLANYCHDNGYLTLPMPAWGLRFVRFLPKSDNLTRSVCRYILSEAVADQEPVGACA